MDDKSKDLSEAEVVKSATSGTCSNKCQQDFEYISNDPQENADNFDPKWAKFKEMTTDEERYLAIKKRWGNSNIPDPTINLTCRQIVITSTDENDSKSASKESKETKTQSTQHSQGTSRTLGRNLGRCKRPRRSRSCTRPYEELISEIEKNCFFEYCQLMFKQKNELQEMLQIQSLQTLGNYYAYPVSNQINQYIKMQQEQQMMNLLSSHYQEVKNIFGKKTENIDACKKFMEEIRAFFTFYQKINDTEVTLQMTDEQYEHSTETEKMYSLYSKYYS